MHFPPILFASICTVMLSGCTQASGDDSETIKRGQLVYAKECSQCHGTRGQGGGLASLGLGVVPPDLTDLKQRNDGQFPREFVRRFVMGLLEKDDPDSPMPEFASVGLQHVYPKGGADGEVLETDFEAMLDYLEAIQE